MPGPCDCVKRRIAAPYVAFVLLLLQPRFILPYLTMCLKNRSSLVERLVLWVCVGRGRAQRVAPPLQFAEHAGLEPKDHEKRDAPLRSLLDRSPGEVFCHLCRYIWLLLLSSSILPLHCASRHSRGFRNRSATRPPVLLSSSCLSQCASWNDSARQQSNRPNRSWRALSPHRQYLWKSGYHSDRVFAAVYAIPCARHLSNE